MEKGEIANMDQKGREAIRAEKRKQREQERSTVRRTEGRQVADQQVRSAALKAAAAWYKGKEEAELFHVADRLLAWIVKSNT